MNTLASIASIGVGATVGASCRYYIGVLSLQYLGKTLPYGTLISNVIGSFIAGILVVVILEKLLLSETYRLMLLVGGFIIDLFAHLPRKIVLPFTKSVWFIMGITITFTVTEIFHQFCTRIA